MLHTKRNSLRGMTLIEVIVAMVVIILVTIIAYAGVNASANLVQRGKDLSDVDAAAVSQIEVGRNVYMTEGACVTEVVPYEVHVIENVTDAGLNPVTSEITAYEETKIAGVVTASMEMAGYNLYMPYITTVPAAGG